jgi:hypothetical protein
LYAPRWGRNRETLRRFNKTEAGENTLPENEVKTVHVLAAKGKTAGYQQHDGAIGGAVRVLRRRRSRREDH